MLRLSILASGSAGNAAIVEDTATGEGILIDCGLTKKAFLAGCADCGFDPAKLRAILITHEHADHTKGLGVVLRGLAKMGVSGLPLFTGAKVRAASREIAAVEDLCEVRPVLVSASGFDAGETALCVRAFRTSHDAAESFGFRITSGDGDALGFMTDTGVVTGEAHETLSGCRVLAIEANHDMKMLSGSPYPYPVKQRIASDLGHLSNDQSAAELALLAHGGLEQVVAMHISEHSNDYVLPVRRLESALDAAGCRAKVRAAFQHRSVSV